MNGGFRSHQRLWNVAAIAAVVVVAITSVTYAKFYRESPAPPFASEEEHFLFGSIGTEVEHGIPYWIWLVLPRVFPEHLPRPGGYAALGVVGVEGSEMPAGFSKITVGYPRVGTNCAFCHTARWRERPGGAARIVPAGPAHQTGAQEYRRFLVACASDDRFTASAILGEIAKNYRLSLLDRALYRFIIIPATRRRILGLDRGGQWTHAGSEWGRGRADVIKDAKLSLLRRAAANTVGMADTVPLWQLRPRDGTSLFWDGSTTSLRESVTVSALAGRTTPDGLNRAASSLARVENYISTAKPPPYPFAVDKGAADAGRKVFEAACAECHSPSGSRYSTVIPIAQIGTDRHRLDVWTAEDAAAFNDVRAGQEADFSAFRKTDGYVAVPLDGVWLRAPYLHNGSVPTLADLLTPPEERPRQFWRGYDVYDPVKVGFVSDGSEARRIGTSHDTSKPGNSNAGHVFGTQLDAGEKRVLLEFLKTQ
jgi:hypothetical protein